MKPQVLLEGAGLFLSGLALHVALWRLRRPGAHALALIAVFSLPVVVKLAACAAVDVDAAAVLLLHAALAAAYIQTYPAVQALSPSLRILLLVGSAGASGLSAAQIEERLGSRSLVTDRIDDLVAAGLVREDSPGTLTVSWRGAMIVPPFLWYRKALGLEAGLG